MASAKTTSHLVSADSLNWALAHVNRYGENDIFPLAFEYGAYKAVWPEVLQILSKEDLATYEVGSALKLLVPKSKWGFRVATQMDPFDCLLYTAMVHEFAPLIEGFRVSPEKKVACAYRLDIDAAGQFFQKHSGWPDFHTTSDILSRLKSCKHVLCADVSDFYNQTSHHRIQNALCSANVPEERANDIELFLGNLNSRHHSRGLPVGPSASVLLAEACLADVDTFLIRKGYQHTRYVDDFRIFCGTREQALSALHDLTEYLFTTHRLSLQGNKTKIFAKDDFRKTELVDPQGMEVQSKQEKIQELLNEIDYSPYNGFDPADFEVDDSTEAELLRDTIRELFVQLVKNRSLNTGLARYLLRRATGLRTRVILDVVLENLEFLLPVLRDVINYVAQTFDKTRPEQVGEPLIALLTKSDHRRFPFIHYWVLDAFCQAPALCHPNKAIQLAESADAQIRDRMCALIARRYALTDWVRARKETWLNSTPFGQRAIIWAAPVLPRDERTHWLKAVAHYPVQSIALIAKAVLSKPS